MSSDEKGTCPLGGDWYTCTDQRPTFFGCCTSDPCNGSGCPSEDLRAAGMGTGRGPDPGFTSNDGSYWPNVQCGVGLWWTCAAQTPSFQGCCESNPCGGSGSGCPKGKLHPAAFQSVPAGLSSTTISTPAAPSSTTSDEPPAILPSSAPESSTINQHSSTQSQSQTPTALTSSNPPQSTLSELTTASTSLSRATSALAESPTSKATPSPEPAKSHSKVPAIAGGVAGGVAFLLLLILALLYNRRRKRRSQNTHLSTNEVDFKPEPKAQHPFDTPESSAYQPYSPDQAHAYNDEAYYPGRPIFGVPHARKISPQPDSPSPPSYISPQPSPMRDIHEIHSNPIHEADGNDGLAIHGIGNSRRDGIAELEDSRRRKRRPVGSMKAVEKKEEGGKGHSRVGSGESYTSWQNFER